MPAYRQDIAGCLSDAIGAHGLDRADLDRLMAQTADALATLRQAHDSGDLPLLRLPAARGDLDALRPIAERLRDRFETVVILGTGGSSLGGQSLYALSDRGFGPEAGGPVLRFFDNVDPDRFDRFLARTDLAQTGFVAISKSGSTAETMTQLLVCMDAVRRAVGEDGLAEHFVAITEPHDNPLRRLAEGRGMTVLEHDPKIGGRYSVLSLVGLLPAMIAGLDPAAVRDGAAEVLTPVLDGAKPEDVAPAVGAAVSVGLARQHGANTTVLMPYADRLADFALWFRQLWAESLGKDGQGTTPVRAVGTVDQHSQLQLYLGGPRDKMYTVLLYPTDGVGPVAPGDIAADPALAYLTDRSMGDLFEAEARATAETLIRNGRPTRLMRLDAVDERTIGALMMHFMLETVIAAHLLGVDPFDQPAVEEGKVLAREYLAKGRAAPS